MSILCSKIFQQSTRLIILPFSTFCHLVLAYFPNFIFPYHERDDSANLTTPVFHIFTLFDLCVLLMWVPSPEIVYFFFSPCQAQSHTIKTKFTRSLIFLEQKISLNSRSIYCSIPLYGAITFYLVIQYLRNFF